MKHHNATYIFERKDDNEVWPAFSESFWTALFGLFVLHLGAGFSADSRLRVWHCRDGSDNKWYEPRRQNPWLQLQNLDFNSLVVEPSKLNGPWPGTKLILSDTDGGFSPDVVIWSKSGLSGSHFIVIENKVTSTAILADNQIENYTRLLKCLRAHEKKFTFEFLVLHSLGCDKKLYEQTRKFQKEWTDHFGILLWEEVLRKMHQTGFAPKGVPISMLQEHTAALESDCL